jgi:hypothetical protein
MSAPLAGKFSDHYEVLGVDSKADTATIKEAYAKLAAQYSPTNPVSGDKEKFDEINAAYECLIDPQMRKTFDSVRSGGAEEADFTFPVAEFIEDLDADAGRRQCLLALLYYRRKYNTISPGISLRQVESVMKVDSNQLAFMTWVLKQQGLVTSDDKSRLLVTVTGIEYVETHKPKAAEVEAWLRSTEEQAAMRPIKPEPVKETAPQPKEKPPLQAAPELTGQGMATAGLSSLRSALQKSMGPKPPAAAPMPAVPRTSAAKP